MGNASAPIDSFEQALSLEADRLPASLAGFAKHALQGGKRIRPRLVEAFGRSCGSLSEDWICFAVSVEFIHKASLIQDDLPCMDSEPERNGRPTLHTVCTPAEAVLTSDIMIAHAFGVCGESASPSESILVLSREVLELAEGQAADLKGVSTRSNADWRAVSDAKTGALFSAATSLAVIASGSRGKSLQAAAAWFGRSLGRVYQWHDDMSDGDAGVLSPSLIDSELSSIREIVRQLPEPAPVASFLERLMQSGIDAHIDKVQSVSSR